MSSLIVRKYGNMLINLKNVTAINKIDSETLEFVYPITNWFSGTSMFISDTSITYKAKVIDADNELKSIQDTLNDYYIKMKCISTKYTFHE